MKLAARLNPGVALLAFLALPPVAAGLESRMATHMLVQIPLLVWAGYLMGVSVSKRLSTRLEDINAWGLTGTLLAGFTLTFWMLPRSIDGALGDPRMEIAKYLSLSLLAGLPLALSWPRLPSVARGFILANLLSMLPLMSWLYLASPERFCSNYVVSQQGLLGWALLALTGALALHWSLRLFIVGKA